jgi:hypothetical protein
MHRRIPEAEEVVEADLQAAEVVQVGVSVVAAAVGSDRASSAS